MCVTSDVAVHVQQPYWGRSLGAAVFPAQPITRRHQQGRRGRDVTGSRDLHGEGQGQGQGRSRQRQQRRRRQPTPIIQRNESQMNEYS